MPKWIVFVGLIVMIASCGEKTEEVVVSMEQPADLIPEDKMIQVLADVHLLESAITFRGPQTASRSPFMVSPNEQAALPPAGQQQALPYYDIFSKYGYTRDQYQRSLRWYSLDATNYSEMYDEVINELTRRQAKEQQNAGITPPVKDSVRK